MPNLIRLFAEDPKVRALVALILLDLVLGIAAAVKAREFRLSYVSGFLKDDVLGKVVPYFALWAGLQLAGDLEIPGLDIGVIEGGAFLMISASLVGSALASLKGLGLMPRLPDSIAGAEPKAVEVVAEKAPKRAPRKRVVVKRTTKARRKP